MRNEQEEIEALRKASIAEFERAQGEAKSNYNALYLAVVGLNIAVFAVAYPLAFSKDVPHAAIPAIVIAARSSGMGFFLGILTMVGSWLSSDAEARFWLENIEAPRSRIYSTVWKRQRRRIVQLQYLFIVVAACLPVFSLIKLLRAS